jgi:hypothetical protein
MADEGGKNCNRLSAKMNSARFPEAFLRHEMCSGPEHVTWLETSRGDHRPPTRRENCATVFCRFWTRERFLATSTFAIGSPTQPVGAGEYFRRIRSYKHGQFGYHVGVAKASLAELETHLEEAPEDNGSPRTLG